MERPPDIMIEKPIISSNYENRKSKDFSPTSFKSGSRHVYDLEPVIEVVEKKGKRVKWDLEIETVKFFKMTDKPSQPSLGIR